MRVWEGQVMHLSNSIQWRAFSTGCCKTERFSDVSTPNWLRKQSTCKEPNSLACANLAELPTHGTWRPGKRKPPCRRAKMDQAGFDYMLRQFIAPVLLARFPSEKLLHALGHTMYLSSAAVTLHRARCPGPLATPPLVGSDHSLHSRQLTVPLDFDRKSPLEGRLRRRWLSALS